MRHDGKQGERGRKVGGESTALVSNGHLHSHQRAPLKHISYAGLDELLWFMRQAHTHKHTHTHLPTINISLCFAVVCDMFTLLFSTLLLLLLCCLSIRLFDCLTICHFCCQQFGVPENVSSFRISQSESHRASMRIFHVWRRNSFRLINMNWVLALWGAHSLHSLNLPLSIVPLISCQLEQTFH